MARPWRENSTLMIRHDCVSMWATTTALFPPPLIKMGCKYFLFSPPPPPSSSPLLLFSSSPLLLFSSSPLFLRILHLLLLLPLSFTPPAFSLHPSSTSFTPPMYLSFSSSLSSSSHSSYLFSWFFLFSFYSTSKTSLFLLFHLLLSSILPSSFLFSFFFPSSYYSSSPPAFLLPCSSFILSFSFYTLPLSYCTRISFSSSSSFSFPLLNKIESVLRKYECNIKNLLYLFLLFKRDEIHKINFFLLSFVVFPGAN